jgi:hypothetical protein
MKFVNLFLIISFICASEKSATELNDIKSDDETAIKESSQSSDYTPKIELTKENQDLKAEVPSDIHFLDATEDSSSAIKAQGLNTIDNNEAGNWILKRLWWQEGKSAYGDILKINDGLLPLQLKFLVLRADSEKFFLEQWLKLNLDENTLFDKFVQFKEKIEAEKLKRQGDLSQEERQELLKIEDSEKNLEALKQMLQDIFQYQIQLDDGLKQVIEHLKTCRLYETDSWDLLQKISRTLDDKLAREYYLQIETNQKNCQNMSDYLHNEYYDYLQKIVTSQNSLLDNIKNSLEQLKSDGYKFENEIAQEIKDDEATVKKRLDEKAKLEREKKQQEQIKKAKTNRSFLDNVYFTLNNWFSKIF